MSSMLSVTMSPASRGFCGAMAALLVFLLALPRVSWTALADGRS